MAGSKNPRLGRGSAYAPVSSHFSTPAITADPSSTRSFNAASRPWLNISCSVSAVARPVGKGKSLRSISELRKYQATQMPKKLTANTHPISCGSGMFPPDSMASAGIGATSPPEMMLADDDAVVCVMLASPTPKRALILRRSRNCQKPAARSNAMIEMLNDQPIFNPEYTLHGVSNAPISMPPATARTVRFLSVNVQKCISDHACICACKSIASSNSVLLRT